MIRSFKLLEDIEDVRKNEIISNHKNREIYFPISGNWNNHAAFSIKTIENNPEMFEEIYEPGTLEDLKIKQNLIWYGT